MISTNQETTKRIAKKIAKELKEGGLVLLYGDLGSGKTTFVKGVAEGLGLEEFRVKSPTYTYVRHLKNRNLNFYHIDLYRLETIDELLEQEIAEITNNPKNIVLIEWADKLFLDPKKAIKVFFQYIDEESREIKIEHKTFTEIDEVEIEKIYKHFFVPNHLIRHMRKVAKVSTTLAKMAEKKSLKLQKNLIVQAALLHDVFRCVDIKNFHPENFNKNPKPAAKKCWLDLRKKYCKIGHEKGMADYLNKEGYPEIANLIAKHGFFEVHKLKTLEEKILYYADKRVEKDKLVSLEKRISEGKKRNIKPDDNRTRVKKTEEAVMKLEKELSKILGQDIDKL